MLKDDLIRLNKIEAELKRRYDGDRLKRYNTGKIKHKKQTRSPPLKRSAA